MTHIANTVLQLRTVAARHIICCCAAEVNINFDHTSGRMLEGNPRHECLNSEPSVGHHEVPVAEDILRVKILLDGSEKAETRRRDGPLEKLFSDLSNCANNTTANYTLSILHEKRAKRDLHYSGVPPTGNFQSQVCNWM